MASSSIKQKSARPRPLKDQDLQNVLDMLDNDNDDDSALTDTYIEDGDSDDDDDDDEDTETNFVNIVDNELGTNINSSDTNEEETTNDDEIIRAVDHNNPIRRAKLPNLQETMNEDNYDRLPSNKHFYGKLKINENIKIINGIPSIIQRKALQGKKFEIDLTLQENPETENLLKSFL